MFRPTGCDLTHRTAIQDMLGVFLGCWGLGGGGGGKRGTRSRCFSSGYHDLGLLQVDYH